MKYYAGLDVSKSRTFICIMNAEGIVMREEDISTDPSAIAYFLKGTGFKFESIGLESGSYSHWLVDGLRDFELPAICIDARQAHGILSAKINKNDKNDAKGIANLMRAKLYCEVHHKSQKAIDIGCLMKARETIVCRKVDIRNSIRGLLKSYGINPKVGSCSEDTFIKKVEQCLKGLPEDLHIIFSSLFNILKALAKEEKELDQMVLKKAKEDENVKLLMTTPGIGVITAMTFISEIDDPRRFTDSRDVGAYLGLTPKLYESGQSSVQGKISKRGPRRLRSLLTEAAIVLLCRSKKWSVLKKWGLQIAKQKGLKKAKVAVARKLAVILHCMWLEKKPFSFQSLEESLLTTNG
jgi:transposase